MTDSTVEPRKWGGRRPNAGRKRKPLPDARTMPAEPKPAASRPGLDLARMAAALPQLIEMSEEYSRKPKRTAENNPYRLPWFPPSAVPKAHAMAMDNLPAFNEASNAWLSASVANGLAAEGLLFPGYSYLSELAQRPEYRIISETIADDATRKWIKLSVIGEEERKERDEAKKAPPAMDADEREDKIKSSGKQDKVKEITDFMTQLQVRDRFYARCRDDGFFGRSHLFLDIKGQGIDEGNAQILKTSIGNGRSEASKALVNKNTPLRDLRVIEPVWTYPMAYNASNPLIADWYNPQFWYVMGQELHVSRILPLVSRPVPDILKPAYAFGGISLSQIAQPYVDIWLKTRESVAELIHAFSVMVLQTDLATTLQPGNANGLIMRAMLFNALRDNQGLMVTNKETEDFKNVSAPLGGLSDLQAQSQEHVASIARIPLVKYTGLQPKGLNASSEGEIRVYYDTITAYQHRSIRPDLTIILNFIQLSLYGEVDPEISFDFEPLWEMSQKEKSEKEKDDADRDMKYVDGGVLSPEEVRTRVANDPTLPYTEIDPDDVPDLAQEEEDGLVPGAASGGKKGGSEGGSSEEGGGTANDNDPFGASDEFNEADHPRGQPGNAGQFGPGGGSSGSAKAAKTKKTAATPSKSLDLKKAPLSPKNLEKTGPKMGTNDGGTFKDKTTGKEFYIKKPQSPAHVTNELLGAKLYQMAGGTTLNYQPVEGGGHVATELVKLDKKNIKDFTPAEKKAAQKDFAVQAWIGNWDAAGTGGDNKGILGGKPTALDFGGALEYRAQGEPKGDAFGKQVNEITTMTDPLKSPDNAALYGSMTMAEQKESAKPVTDLTNDAIITAVKEAGGTATLAQKLIDRKASLANMYGLMTDMSKWDDAKHPRNPDGTFAKGTGGEEGGSPIAKEWAQESDAKGLTSTFDATKHPDIIVYHGLKKGHKREGFLFVTRDKNAAATHGDVEAFTIKDGSKLYADMEEGKKTGEEGLLDTKVGESSGIVHFNDLEPAAAIGENEEGKATLSAGQEFTAATGLKPSDFDGFEQYMEAVEKFKKGQQQKAEAVAKEMEDPAAAAAGEGGEVLKPGAYGGLWKAGGDGTPEGDFAHNAGFYSKAKTQIGIHYRRMLAKLIKDAPAQGLESAVPDLKLKLIESLGLSYQKLIEKGDTAGAQKLAQTLSKLVGPAPAKSAPPPPAPKVAPAPAPKSPNNIEAVKKFSPKFAAEVAEIEEEKLPPPSSGLQKMAAAIVSGDATAEALEAMLSPNEKKWMTDVYGSVQAAYNAANNKAGTAGKAVEMYEKKKSNSEFAKGLIKKTEKAPAAPPAPKVAQATPDELKKASKVTNVPVPADIKPEAKKAIEKFNMEYGVGTPAITDPAKLNKKVADYKAMQAEVAAINLKHMDEIKAAAAEKQKAEALKATKKLEDEAKALAQQFKDNPEMKTHYEAIQSLTGGGKAAQNYMANARAKVKAAGLEGVIRGEEAASIIAYSGSHYAPLNAALREGVTTVGQYKFMKSLNHALDKLPPYTKTTTRKASLTPQQFALYKPGMVVEERGFTSSSKNSGVWSGSYHYTIHGKTGRDISNLSSHPQEAEVLFKSGTRFAVKSVKGNEIELEEID